MKYLRIASLLLLFPGCVSMRCHQRKVLEARLWEIARSEQQIRTEGPEAALAWLKIRESNYRTQLLAHDTEWGSGY